MERYRTSSTRRSRYQNDPDDGWLHILLFYILPFVVFNGLLYLCVMTKPSLAITVGDTHDYLSTEITVSVTSRFPSDMPTVTLDGEPLELTKEKNRTYKATIYKNGSIEANVKNKNGMMATVFEQVNVLDDVPPAIENTNVSDGVLTLTVTDSQAGINFDSIHAVDSNNQPVAPVAENRTTNTVSYKMDSNGLHVYAQDKAGNEVHGTFTSRKEGGVETLETNVDEQDGDAGDAASSAGGAAASETTVTVN